jgi:hypothetical protein
MKRISFETLKDLSPRKDGLSQAEVASQGSR